MTLGDLTDRAAVCLDVQERHPLDLEFRLSGPKVLDLTADEGERLTLKEAAPFGRVSSQVGFG